MPIQRVVNQYRPGTGLPIIATIHKGGPKTEGGIGPDLDYFRVDFKGPFQQYQSKFIEMYGEKPTVFDDAYFLGETVDEVFEFWYEKKDSTTLHRRCDGTQQVKWFDEGHQRYSSDPRPCQCDHTKTSKQNCKQDGQLRFVLPQFSAIANAPLGYFLAYTSSQNDIFMLYKALNDIAHQVGRLNQIRFIFGRAAVSTTSPKQVKQGKEYVNDGRIRIERSLLYLHIHPDATRQQFLPALTNAGALPAQVDTNAGALPAQVDTNTGEIVSGGAPLPSGRPATWVDDKAQLEKFLNWALARFNFHADDVVIAFDHAMTYGDDDPEIVLLTDWRGDETTSLAAVIALAADYDLGRIKQITDAGYKPEVYKAAEKIATLWDMDQQAMLEAAVEE